MKLFLDYFCLMATEKEQKKAFQSFSGKGVCPYQFAFTLLLPVRDLILSPRKLLRMLPLQEDSEVLEVGPGPGYFSPHIARAIPNGKLTLADIQPEMLAYAKKRIEKKGLKNVAYHLCDGTAFPFPPASFDVIFLVAVLGEIENKALYAAEFYRMLKPQGHLSVSELPGDPDRMEREEITALLERHGFMLKKSFGRRRNFTLLFRKKEIVV